MPHMPDDDGPCIGLCAGCSSSCPHVDVRACNPGRIPVVAGERVDPDTLEPIQPAGWRDVLIDVLILLAVAACVWPMFLLIGWVA